MRTHTHTTTTALALALAVALGGCTGGGGEPTDSTSTASGPSSSTNDDQALAKSAEDTYREYWPLWVSRSPSQEPTEEQRALMTEESYRTAVDYAKTAPPTKVVGKDTLVSTTVTTKWSTAGPTAAVEVCYEAGRKFVLTEDVTAEDGTILKKGEDIRTDPDGEAIKPGTQMGQVVTMKRGRQEDDPWRVDGAKPSQVSACSGGGQG